VHLPRLLKSIKGLDAPVFILDSGSTDNTIPIGREFNAGMLQHPFENHPAQWDFALKDFNIQTPWVICLDADQIVTPGLHNRLENFNNEDYAEVNGIYFNRKNFFKGRWIKHGGYSPFYLLKMFRYGKGYSDLNEGMDHRFIVPGKTMIWKDGYLLEENLKENCIRFWIDKHNRYSDLLAHEEVERMQQRRVQTLKPRFFGSPDERTARFKRLWWQLPRYLRPMLYFIYRLIFQMGILDGRTGIIFHFLQAFWFRLIVDIKIDEILQRQKGAVKIQARKKNGPLKFVALFVILFAAFYYFNIFYFSVTNQGGKYYNAFFAHYLNYIAALRWLVLNASAQMLNWLGYASITNKYELLVAGHGVLQVVYSCLGLGLISFFAAFVIAYPKRRRVKTAFLIGGILGIELLNVIRFIVLAIFWDKQNNRMFDHHTVFNIFMYFVIAMSLYFWVRYDSALDENNEAN
jgi:exosortase/archaeosortase family protein